MNGYGIAAILIGFVAWSGFMYYEGTSKEIAVCGKETEKTTVTQQTGTIAAQDGVISTIAAQQHVTQGVDDDYQHRKNNIDYVYNNVTARLQLPKPTISPTGDSLPAPTSPTLRPNVAARRPFVSKVFRLNRKECDDNTAKLYSLQDWIKGQQAIKALAAK